jgi:hypothetical protein
MRKVVSAAIAGLVLSGVLLAGGSTATAAPATAAPATAAPAASVATQTAQQTPSGQHVYFDWYSSLSGCNSAGENLLDNGVVYEFSCELSIYLTYYLYIWYD